MRKWTRYSSGRTDLLQHLCARLGRSGTGVILNSNAGKGAHFGLLAGFGAKHEITCGETPGAFAELERFLEQHRDHAFGHFGYDLKNAIEQLSTPQPDRTGFPPLYFFVPGLIVKSVGDEIAVGEFGPPTSVDDLFSESIEAPQQFPAPVLQARTGKEDYLAHAGKLITHIHRGDIYEINYCMEYFAENVRIDPVAVYLRLNALTEAPFSALYKHGDSWLLCGSPERFMRNKNGRISSMPIKGTRPRGKTPEEDEQLKRGLFLDPKERSENVMIVDLVRNDLSRSAKKGSVRVDELFGIYSFRSVHQMISTVSAELREDVHPVEAIRRAFPMGSMTGAPKVRAMQLAGEHEQMRRGLYSGALGYFTPELDFDLNVVIRSIQYNAKTGYLSLMVGSALTANADPEKEYEECLLKAETLFGALRNG
jgi:para-aminobenzoate synthetase component I